MFGTDSADPDLNMLRTDPVGKAHEQKYIQTKTMIFHELKNKEMDELMLAK